MIPLPFISPAENAKFQLELGELRELRSGTFPGLDVVCDGILNGSSFVFPAEATQHLGAALQKSSDYRVPC